MTKKIGVSYLLVFILSLVSVKGYCNEIDEQTGLKKTDNWDIVKQNCTGCHSAKLITQNAGNKSNWQSLIKWMQETQGLWQFQPEVEEKILQYLSQNYGPKKNQRRLPLSKHLLPNYNNS